MTILSKCTHCHAKFKADEKFAGRKVRCPQCRETVQLPGPPPPVSTASPRPVTPSASRTRQPEPFTSPPNHGSPNSGENAPHFPEISTNYVETSPSTAQRQPARWPWIALAGVVGCLAASIVAGLLVWPTVATPARKTNTGTQKPGTHSPAPQSLTAILEFHWPPAERQAASLRIDGQEQTLQPTGALRFPLPPGKHQLVIQRPGYDRIESAVDIPAEGIQSYAPEWTPLSQPSLDTPATIGTAPQGFSGWLQDLQMAQNECRQEKKRLLIVFGCSDASETTQRLARDVFLDPSFRQYAADKFKLVVIDFPKTQDGISLVEDVGQNNFLRDKYSVASLPTVVLADADGIPYGWFENAAGPATEFIAQVAGVMDDLEKRETLLAATRQGTAEERFAAVLTVAQWLQARSALTFYENRLQDWMQLAKAVDPDNDAGQYEILFELFWLVSLDQTDANVAEDLLPVIGMLQSWHRSHRFQDSNRAVRLHLLGAVLFEQLKHEESAAEMIGAAQAYQPSDPKLAAQLRNASKFIAGRQQLSSGTGFVVDASGLILTNNHVIAGTGRTTVRINDSTPPLAAEVVGTDPKRDLALLKIPVPTGTQLTAIRLADRIPRRGEQVAAFGYPLGDALGTGLKLTRGVISGTPDPSNDNMMLLDLTINPGNSGGPLCDGHGNVVGMVTAKSANAGNLDSYGMALPAADLVTFLQQHLPQYQPTPTAQNTAPKPWEEVDQMVSPSVFIVLKLK